MITTVWQSMLRVASVLSNLIAYGFYHLPRVTRGYYTWQWMNACIAGMSGIAASEWNPNVHDLATPGSRYSFCPCLLARYTDACQMGV